MLIKTLLEKQKYTNIQLFDEFLNDYLEQFDNIEDYIIDISKRLSCDNYKLLTFQQLKASIKQLNILENAWLVESLASLIEYIDCLDIRNKENISLLELLINDHLSNSNRRTE